MSEHLLLVDALDACVRTLDPLSRCPALVGVLARQFLVGAAALFVVAGIAGDSITAEASAGPKIKHVELGIKNHFKVGFWTPVVVEVEDAGQSATQQVEVTVSDSDGVPTISSAKLASSEMGHETTKAVIYTKVGRVGNPIQTTLVDRQRRLDEKMIRRNAKGNAALPVVAMPATAEFIVSLGTAPFGVSEAFPSRESDAASSARFVVELTRVNDLPTEWFGYHAVDVLVLS